MYDLLYEPNSHYCRYISIYAEYAVCATFAERQPIAHLMQPSKNGLSHKIYFMRKIPHCCTAAFFVTYNATFDERSASKDLLYKQKTATTTAVLSSIPNMQRRQPSTNGPGARDLLYKHN